ncbi:MAG: hypothetical protein HW421_3779 [Ignavibacteria bacterium]|nr:hypothetical protein [Ignavibacteria bacterium]
MNFDDVLEVADNLTIDKQFEISEILHKRAINSRREQLKIEIEQARDEHFSGKLHPLSPEEIMKEIYEVY